LRVLCIFRIWLAAAFLTTLAINATAQDDPSHPSTPEQKALFVLKAEKAFNNAKANFTAHPEKPEAAWKFGQAAYDWAEFATSNAQRAEIANQGIAACRALVEHDPNSAPGHYYLALNLGELAETRKLSALKIVSEMESELKTTINLDPMLDYAGAERSIGLLYLQAPGWPASIGSNAKARQYLTKAEKLAPNYPENILNLIEAQLKWGEKSSAQHHIKTADDLWPAAQKEFTGETWASSWLDWNARLESFRKKASAPPRTIESPHNR